VRFPPQGQRGSCLLYSPQERPSKRARRIAPAEDLRSRHQSTPARRSSEEEDRWKATTLYCAAVAQPGLAPSLTFVPQIGVQGEEQRNRTSAESAPGLNMAAS